MYRAMRLMKAVACAVVSAEAAVLQIADRPTSEHEGRGRTCGEGGQ
jgi:hypothetical protein